MTAMGFTGKPMIVLLNGIASKTQPYSLQLRILQRAMKLIKPDGRIVYSTCSLNPVENEAVIASALKSYPGK